MTELSPEEQAGIDKMKGALGIGSPEVAMPVGPEIDGSKINWQEYELEAGYEHFYPRARLEQLEQGAKWVAPVTEFHNEDAPFHKGKLAKYLEAQINGPNGWALVAIVPNGSGLSNVVLRRNNFIALPDPKKIGGEEKIEAPSAVQLDAFDEAAKKWEETQ